MESISLDFDTKKNLIKKYRLPDDEPEMSEAQTAFLCGLLKEYKPRRILEVGVAGGGTTAIMMQCLHELEYDYKMYSVDLCEMFYRDKTKKTGWIAEDVKRMLGVKEHVMLLGKPLPACLNAIISEGSIDFVLLDTAHTVPGEILDFLLLLPYLSENAIVCLHDVSMNLKQMTAAQGIATNALFNAVVARKYLNLDLESAELNTYPNIGAFQITDDTKKYIENVFGTLTLTWGLTPSDETLSLYRQFFSENYESTLIELFDRAVEMNKNIKNPMSMRIRAAAKMLLKGKY